MKGERLPKLSRLVYAEWDEAPKEMAFEASWGEILAECAELAVLLGEGLPTALSAPASMPESYWSAARRLFVRLPSIVNVPLNWKICVELGLPLHPTQYFEVDGPALGSIQHPAPLVEEAPILLERAVDAARALMRLDEGAAELTRGLRVSADPAMPGFMFTSKPDKYTWRGSDPSKILALAGRVEASGFGAGQRGLVVGAAHGSLVPGLVLAETLGWDLSFVRFSMFKRADTFPVLTPSDVASFKRRHGVPTLLFDEDVAKGTTLRIFTETLAPHFAECRSAAVIRHGLAGFRPDFTGVEWFD
ncbi:MAG: hypothetical protein WCQ50_14700 [Spirochaetota bacterium]